VEIRSSVAAGQTPTSVGLPSGASRSVLSLGRSSVENQMSGQGSLTQTRSTAPFASNAPQSRASSTGNPGEVIHASLSFQLAFSLKLTGVTRVPSFCHQFWTASQRADRHRLKFQLASLNPFCLRQFHLLRVKLPQKQAMRLLCGHLLKTR
jgi:hypothetical protein